MGASDTPIPDATLTELIRSASRIIDRKTGTWWDSRECRLTYTGNGSEFLWLPAPAITLASVVENTVTLVEITSTVTTGTFYSRYDLKALEKAGSLAWSTVPNAVLVEGTFGYSAMTVVPDVVSLTCAIAGAIGEFRKRAYIDDAGNLAEVPVSAWPGWVTKELDRLRWRPVGVGRPTVTYIE